MARYLSVPFLIGLLLLGVVCAQDEYEGGDGGDYGGDYGDGGDYGGGDYGDYGDYGMEGMEGMGGMPGMGGAEAGPESHITGVLDLDDKTFDKVITGSHHVFIEFYAPWCGHCKSFAEEYAAVAEQMGDSANLILAKVDADSNKGLAEKFAIEGFPTLVFMEKGTLDQSVYEGDRTSAAIVDFLSDKAGGVGTVEALAPLVIEYVQATNKDAVAEKMKETVATLTGSDATYGAYYVKITDKVKEKGVDFPKTELDRLERMIAGGALKADKESEFKARCAALKVFTKAGSEQHTEL